MRLNMEKTLIFGHKNPDTDSICSSLVMADLQTKLGQEVEACRLGELNKETKYALGYLNIDAPKKIEKVEEGTKVILVDHNEKGHTVEGIEKAKIKMLVDHHKIANFETTEPTTIYTEPVGCTSTILFKLYKMNNIEIEPKIAGLMLSAIISDTLLLKSPTCTEDDIKAVEKLEKIAKLDKDVYGLDMLKAGTDLDDLTVTELIDIDSKDFEKNGVKYTVAQVNTVNIPDILKRQDELEAEMSKIIENKKLDLFVFVITDILNSNSEIIALGNRTDIIEKTAKLENNRTLLKGVVSRKKQLLPIIESNI